MTVVVDASVALKWFVAEPGAEQARTLLAEETPLTAPELVIAEVCNGAWRLARLGVLGWSECALIAAEIGGWFDRLAALGPLAPRAAAIARVLDHPVYDCFYVALAEQEAGRLVTADRRLVERLRGTEWSPLVQDLYTLPSDR
jgi:predicted nucleic acid-binding protein